MHCTYITLFNPTQDTSSAVTMPLYLVGMLPWCNPKYDVLPTIRLTPKNDIRYLTIRLVRKAEHIALFTRKNKYNSVEMNDVVGVLGD